MILIIVSGNYWGVKLYVFGVLCSFCFGGYICLGNFCVNGSDIFFGSGSGGFIIIDLGNENIFGEKNLVFIFFYVEI